MLAIADHAGPGSRRDRQVSFYYVWVTTTRTREDAWHGVYTSSRTSAPRVAKLADRMLGETMTEFLSHLSTRALALTRNAALVLTAVRLAVTRAPARALRAKTAELAEMADMVDGVRRGSGAPFGGGKLKGFLAKSGRLHIFSDFFDAVRVSRFDSLFAAPAPRVPDSSFARFVLDDPSPRPRWLSRSPCPPS